MRRRVVVTGAGCVTPLGGNVAEVWEGLTEGRSGIGPITLFDASDLPIRIAAEVRNWDLSDVGEDPDAWQTHPRQTAFAVGAAIQAVRSAGLEEARLDPLRLGVYLGCGETYQDFFQFAQWTSAAARNGPFEQLRFLEAVLREEHADAGLQFELNMPAHLLAGVFNAQGPNLNCTATCVSSAQAIGEATETIRRGQADVMLAGGAHSMIHPFGVSGFHRLAVLSEHNDAGPKAMRPFDRDRNGFVIGEGGAILVLESLEHAQRRGAEIWGELTGYGSTHDAFRLTDADPGARGATTCIARALHDAWLHPDEIDYVNAHGTSTKLNDKVETLAIKQAFGPRAYDLPISSTKSMMGHLTTACGAIETLVSLMVVRSGAVPPTINYETSDPECDLDYVPNCTRELPCRHALSNSLGFGGQNAALIVSRFDERTGPGVSCCAV
ncbi:MAG: beta-ketoacyl-[acyl-carrier-protein] synthase family protein [Pirellulales bacterium]|nr:beta-ketoacyl-[acyl-carrier-protein] synthase family protein [Pirellulales bacterium]